MAGGKADNPSPTSSGGCPTDAPKGADAPVCTDEDCKGPNDGPKDKVRVCSEGKWKDCPCLRSGTFIAEATDPDYLKAQQDMFQWVLDHDGDFSKPWCIHGASPRSGRTPSDYCMCGENGATYYPIAEKKEGEEYNPCPYTEKDHPKETLTFQDPPKQTEAPPPPPPAPQPTCNTNPCGDFEKAKKDFPWVHLGTATEAGHKFCADNKGKAVVEGRDNLQGTYDDAPDHKNFEGGPMQFLIKVDRVDTNADKTLDEKDCNTAVDVILNGCDTCSNDIKFGGKIEINGVIFRINPMRYIPCITC
ncbi:uncharacterized protein EI97DRAFT_437863 [Westerdykella ornata]|uniref:Uncharacterized protein n=1 Tax=Westerdykella ornata TaxID=318751 RepID=A0A6A6J4R9_WESOR|nr:uncharacterized protein EI97DRAFT_437863 [Westerdykella ornata]KAF2271435.1 hypothetical protein EI97DRAFT_437863 [Westerdykella ornata]